eukprot:528648-Prorocentrum_minimum.AAC.1
MQSSDWWSCTDPFPTRYAGTRGPVGPGGANAVRVRAGERDAPARRSGRRDHVLHPHTLQRAGAAQAGPHRMRQRVRPHRALAGTFKNVNPPPPLVNPPPPLVNRPPPL